jgi:hypothetical protein
MTTWLSDPIVRSGWRQAFALTRVLPLIPLIVIESMNRSDGRATRIGVVALCFAAPQAAAYLLEMEHDGRLDQIRLSGRRPAALAALALATVAVPWLAMGVAFTSLAMIKEGFSARLLVAIAAVAGLPTALAALSTTVTFTRERIDPRIGAAALGVAAMAIGLIGANEIDRLTGVVPGLVVAVVAEGAVIGYCLWTLPRRIAYPPARAEVRAARFRVPRWDWLLRRPGIYRGAVLSSSGLALFALFAPMGIVVRILADRNTQAILTPALYLPPLFIGLIAVALICREDIVSGRLDLVRQSSRPVAVVAFEMLIGLWAPFVVAAIGLFLLVQVLFGVSIVDPLGAIVAMVLIAPLPLCEGWSRQWPLTYVMPFGFALALLMNMEAWSAVAAASAIVWLAAARTLSQPDRPALPGWQGMMAILVLTTTTLLNAERFDRLFVSLNMTTMLIAVSPILIMSKPRGWTERWGQFLAVLSGISIVRLPQLGAGDAAYLSAMGLAVWLAVYRSRQLDPSGMIQAAVRFALLIGLALVEAVPSAPGQRERRLLTAVIAVAVTIELLHRGPAWIARRRRRPILPT